MSYHDCLFLGATKVQYFITCTRFFFFLIYSFISFDMVPVDHHHQISLSFFIGLFNFIFLCHHSSMFIYVIMLPLFFLNILSNPLRSLFCFGYCMGLSCDTMYSINHC
ncbi:hypothetical protein GLYMA_13G247900v4 [Glycine max]|uniref:Uncharacterized protein n=1 Tax=Glycine max TaxID=3847 RepID=A0A0R0GTK0_SOYBN|nr:hypothetical protein GYH30_037285 [Glycine max]KRH21597.1 hypothetical protein GLYMA_13G247900v4 [Glycine max]